VLSPRTAQARQYIADERAALLARARLLAEGAPTSEVAWARYAQALVSASEIDQAVVAASKTLRLASRASMPDDMETPVKAACFVAARVLATAGNEAEAEAAFARLPGTGPWNVFYAAFAERRGEYRQALARLGDAQSAEALAFRGFVLLQIGEPHRALAQLRAAQRAGGSAPSLLLNLAYAYALAGSPHKAVRSARQAVALAPDSRHASFNLASYLRAVGLVKEALAELNRLRAIVGDSDVRVAAAMADAYIACGDPHQALRELRRAQHHNTFSRGSMRYAELVANTALLEWRFTGRERASALKVIRNQLKAAGPHLPLALMLADVGSIDALGEVEGLHRRLQESLPEGELAPLTIRLRMLQGDLSAAARTAMEYAEANPLDPDAIRGAIILHGQVFGEYDLAAEIGQRALRRIPADRMLRNNVAFCLTLAGRARDADQVLAKQTLDDPFLLATRGLVDFGLGKVASGLAHYDEAARLGSSVMSGETEADFSRLLRTQEVLVLHQLGLTTHADVPQELLVTAVPAEWQRDPTYLLLHRVAEREDIPWNVVRMS
jgi:tetratricopeptide (TPR) repeat protein